MDDGFGVGLALLTIASLVAGVGLVVAVVRAHERASAAEDALARLRRRIERLEEAANAAPSPAPPVAAAGPVGGAAAGAGSVGEIVQRIVEAAQRDARAAAPPVAPSASTAAASAAAPAAATAVASPVDAARLTAGGAQPHPAARRALEMGPPGDVDWAKLEALIGERWLTWLGGLVVFVAGAFAVRWAFVHGVVGPVGRLLLGIGAGIAVVLGGDGVARRGPKPVGQALIALGVGVLYAAWFGGYALGASPPLGATPAFAGMAAITVLAVWLALRHESSALAQLATLGALLTPVLVGRDTGARAPLFAYLLGVDAGAALLALARAWPWPRRIAFVGTLAIAGAWCGRHPERAHELAMAAWQAALAALFLAAPLGFHLRRREPVSLDALMLVVANACAAAIGIWATQGGDRPHLAAAWLALFAAPHALLALRARRWFGGDDRAGGAFVAIAAALVAGAIAMRWQGHVVTWAWAAQSALLTWLGWRYASRSARVVAALIALVVGVRGFVALVGCGENEPLFNGDLAAALAGPALLAWAAALARMHAARDDEALVARWGCAIAQLLAQAWLSIALARVAVDAAIEPIACVWLVGAVIAAAVANRVVAAPSFTAFGVSLLVAGTLILSAYAQPRDPWSDRFWCGLAWLGIVAAAARRWRHGDRDLLATARGAAAVAVVGGGWLLLSLQTWVAATAAWDHRAALVALSAAWVAYAVASLVVGMRWRWRGLRLAALALFGATMAKLALVDLASLHDLERIASFAVVGVVMIAASWLYHRLERRFGDRG